TNRMPLSFYIVQIGDDVTLSTANGLNKRNCESSTWIFSDLKNMKTVTLLESGQFLNIAKAKSNRLFITADCSLVIKNFSVHDAGCYTSRYYLLEQQHGPDFRIYVSVINLAEEKNDGKVTLFCSMFENDGCMHSVKWVFEGEEKMSSEMEIATSSCSSNVTFTASDPELHKSLKCKVMNYYTDTVWLFDFRSQSSDEKSDFVYLMRCSILSLGLAALIISVVTFEIWTKGNEKKIDGIVEGESDEDEDPAIYEEIGENCPSVMLQQ
ncbi:hypothetical protein XENOCAPTIV_028802, partial [Xenoophorus captivus]